MQEGIAKDGYKYTSESPEVKHYRQIFPDVAEDASIGTVLNMRNALLDGGTPANPGDNAEVNALIEEIRATIETNENEGGAGEADEETASEDEGAGEDTGA